MAKKRAPNEYPVPPKLAAILCAHREARIAKKKEDGDPSPKLTWMFPSASGTLRTPNTMDAAWVKCLEIAGITKRFTLHGTLSRHRSGARREMLTAGCSPTRRPGTATGAM